jgi:hypothetical protein
VKWLRGGFPVPQGDEAAGETQMGLLFQYEAAVGPALGGLLVKDTGAFPFTPRLGESPLA